MVFNDAANSNADSSGREYMLHRTTCLNQKMGRRLYRPLHLVRRLTLLHKPLFHHEISFLGLLLFSSIAIFFYSISTGKLS